MKRSADYYLRTPWFRVLERICAPHRVLWPVLCRLDRLGYRKADRPDF